MMERLARIAATVAALSASIGCSSSETTTADTRSDPLELAGESATHAFDVTIENLTTGQPLSPGVILTHTKGASLFEVGAVASNGVRLIAENGDPSTALSALDGAQGVFEVQTLPGPIHRQGGPGSTMVTVRIHARADANRLSFATMLICTNDGFTGVHGVKLPAGFKPEIFFANAYDSGSEANDELSTSIVDPCFLAGPVAGSTSDGNARTATSGTIAAHPGIDGTIGELTSAHRWSGAIVKVTVQRVD